MFRQTFLKLHLSAKKLGNGEDIFLSAELQKEGQYIVCYVMCDEMGKICPGYSLLVVFANQPKAGTLRYAELKPQISASAFPSTSTASPIGPRPTRIAQDVNISTGHSKNVAFIGGHAARLKLDEEFPDDDIDDRDLLAAGMVHCGNDHAIKALRITKRMK